MKAEVTSDVTLADRQFQICWDKYSPLQVSLKSPITSFRVVTLTPLHKFEMFSIVFSIVFSNCQMEQTAGKPGAGATTSEGLFFILLFLSNYAFLFRSSGKLFQFTAKQENWGNGWSRTGINILIALVLMWLWLCPTSGPTWEFGLSARSCGSPWPWCACPGWLWVPPFINCLAEYMKVFDWS